MNSWEKGPGLFFLVAVTFLDDAVNHMVQGCLLSCLDSIQRQGDGERGKHAFSLKVEPGHYTYTHIPLAKIYSQGPWKRPSAKAKTMDTRL